MVNFSNGGCVIQEHIFEDVAIREDIDGLFYLVTKEKAEKKFKNIRNAAMEILLQQIFDFIALVFMVTNVMFEV